MPFPNRKLRRLIFWVLPSELSQQTSAYDAQLRQVLTEPLFQRIEHVTIFAPNNLPECRIPHWFEVIRESLPCLKCLEIEGGIDRNTKPGEPMQRIFENAIELKKLMPSGCGQLSASILVNHVNQASTIHQFPDEEFEMLQDLAMQFSRGGLGYQLIFLLSEYTLQEAEIILDFAIAHGIRVRFCLVDANSDPIRLNRETSQKIYSADAAYALSLFLHKAEIRYEKNPSVQREYRFLRNILTGTANEVRDPPALLDSVTLDTRFGLHIAPWLPAVGSALENPASQLFSRTLAERKNLMQRFRSTSYTVLQAPVPNRLQAATTKFWLRALSLDQGMRIAQRLDKI